MKILNKSFAVIAAALLLTACGSAAESAGSAAETTSVTAAVSSSENAEITSEQETAPTETSAAETAAPVTEVSEQVTAPQQEVGFEGMTAINADALKDGEYHIGVDSSSSMFKIADCVLKVGEGGMTADIIIASKSYDYLFMGTAEEAAADSGEGFIAYTSDDEDRSVFTVPVEALDSEIKCAALSAKKQEWYDRTLVFRADSLPDEAFAESRYASPEALGLADGEYSVEVALEGGSGKASVQSPAKLTVKDGKATAEIVWSSNKYDYMTVDGEKILPDSMEEFSVFTIPVKGFGSPLNVTADTTAMSQPHEIDYTLTFDQESLK